MKDMPVYEYECPCCGHAFEEAHPVSMADEVARRPCEACGADARRVLSRGSFRLGGHCWSGDGFQESSLKKAVEDADGRGDPPGGWT
jgi:putative FmdB family regulatory protein